MPPRLLVVEDSPLLVRPLIRLLAKTGYEIDHVDTCDAARAVSGHFDAGVFDVELPDGLGIELCAELLARRTVERAIFYTGVAHERLLRHAEQIAPVVRKSEEVGALLRAIARAVSAQPSWDVSSSVVWPERRSSYS
jgi:CheY-like chemotaxis protein